MNLQQQSRVESSYPGRGADCATGALRGCNQSDITRFRLVNRDRRPTRSHTLGRGLPK